MIEMRSVCKPWPSGPKWRVRNVLDVSRGHVARLTRACGLVLVLTTLSFGQSAQGQDATPTIRERLQPLADTISTSVAADEDTLPEGVPFSVRFRGDIRNLKPGADVTVLGRRVGTVRDVTTTFNSEEGAFEAVVVFDVVPARLTVDGTQLDTTDALYDAAETMVTRGLRARVPGSLLVGRDARLDLMIESDAQSAALGRDGPYPEIPAATDQADKLRKTVDTLMVRIANLPVERLAQEGEAAIVALRELLTGPELKEMLANVAVAAEDLKALGGTIEDRTEQVFQNLIKASDAARQAANHATQTIAALDASVGAKSLLWGDLERLLSELTGTLRSLRQFTEYLERHPEALIRGKSGGG